MLNTLISQKRDTLDNWLSSTDIPINGCICVATTNTDIIIKIGDGVHTFSELLGGNTQSNIQVKTIGSNQSPASSPTITLENNTEYYVVYSGVCTINAISQSGSGYDSTKAYDAYVKLYPCDGGISTLPITITDAEPCFTNPNVEDILYGGRSNSIFELYFKNGYYTLICDTNGTEGK